jgi:Cu-Zn family superoxide dismutase
MLAVMLFLVILVAGCTAESGNAPPKPAASVTASGTFAPYASGATAVSYDPALVPAGATATVTITPTQLGTKIKPTPPGTEGKPTPPGPEIKPTQPGTKIKPTPSGTEIRLAVTGLQPRRSYGAHLHTNPCGPTGAAAGPHYQHKPDPAASASPPSVNPSYANPHNEVWLDFTTDARGDATSAASQQWTFDAGRRPRSLVIHADTTKTAAGHAGDAGARVACLTLPG